MNSQNEQLLEPILIDNLSELRFGYDELVNQQALSDDSWLKNLETVGKIELKNCFPS